MSPQQWFLGAVAVGGVMAVGMVISAVTGFAGYEALAGLLFPGGMDPMGDSAFFHAGIAGGLFAGWSATMFLLARDEGIAREPGLWNAVAWGLAVWFVLDSGASVLTGGVWNVIGNLGFLVALGAPVLAMRRLTAGRAEVVVG